ncbi:hypothetical protein V490_02159 [Pseudogymnoascus sp. VKM F-3557]|nr:hypothetical protein V490_02159 [Pseudogymnoascus sp. VKM F-3557]
MPDTLKPEEPLDIAIVGGGIVGLALVLGLQHRGIRVTLYEKTSAFRPIGAGIGFTPNSLRALELLHPKAIEAQRRVTTPNGDPKNPNDWLTYLDGYHVNSDNPNDTEEKLLFQLHTGFRGFEGCVRAHLLDEFLKLIPPETIKFSKSIDQVIDQGVDKKVLLQFEDGTTAGADAVIGCDGIKSRVRKLILGSNHPAAEPSYNHQYALRGLIPIDLAIAALGEHKARNRHMHLGPGSYVITVPVGHGAMVNLVAFLQDPNEWPDTTRLTAPADREEVERAFSHFAKPVRGIIKALFDSSPHLDRWAIFDSAEHPAPTYAVGRIAIAGDAAHAAAPHHGAGAGMGIEDCLVLSTLLAEVVGSTANAGVSKAAAVRAALVAYSEVRMERTKWVVESSRVIGELLEWRYLGTLRDFGKCLEELTWRSHRIWHYDEKKMLNEARAEYEKLLNSGAEKEMLLEGAKGNGGAEAATVSVM